MMDLPKTNLRTLKGYLSNSKLWQATIMIAVILLAVGCVLVQRANFSMNVGLDARVSVVEKTLNVPFNGNLSVFRKSNSYIISLVNAYAYLQNGTNGKSVEFSTNHTLIIQDGLGNASIRGGSVYIADGSYSAAVVLQDDTRFVLDEGARGVTYTVASGANCVLDDFNNGYFECYRDGVLYSRLDYAHGNLLIQSANLTTVYAATIDELVSGQGFKILHLVVENGTSFPTSPVDKQVFFRSDLGYLYVYNNSLWTQIGTTAYGNLTGTPDLAVFLTKDGMSALTGDWNVGESYGIYGCTWVNSTSFAGAGQLWWDGQNRTDVVANPAQTASYIVYTDGTNYYAKNGTTGQVDFSSADASLLITRAIGNLATDRTWQQEILLMGNITLDSVIKLPSFTKIEVQGELSLKPNSDCYIFTNSGGNTSSQVQVEICGGTIDCNDAAQSSGGYIQWFVRGNSDRSGSDTGLRVHDQFILNPHDFGISVDGTAGTAKGAAECRFANIVIKGGTTGMRLQSADDIMLDNVWINSFSVYGLYVYGGGGDVVSNCYFGGEGINNVYLNSCNMISFSNCVVDSAGQEGVYVTSAYGHNTPLVWTGGRITNNGKSSAGTYAGVYIQYVWNTLWEGVWDGNTEPTKWQRYGFQEQYDALYQADWNIVIGCRFYDCSTAGIVAYGSNTQVHSCYNGTTWIN
jgi:hypothetical protein